MITKAYIDTSAAAKLLLREAESDALRATVGSYQLYSSDLLETELRRIAVREGIPQEAVTKLLGRMTLFAVDREVFVEAGTYPGRNLRSLDALHLVSARRAELPVLIAYDARLCTAAEEAGIKVLSPKPEPESEKASPNEPSKPARAADAQTEPSHPQHLPETALPAPADEHP